MLIILTLRYVFFNYLQYSLLIEKCYGCKVGLIFYIKIIFVTFFASTNT